MKDLGCLVNDKMRITHVQLAESVRIVGISLAVKDDKHRGFLISSRSEQGDS